MYRYWIIKNWSQIRIENIMTIYGGTRCFDIHKTCFLITYGVTDQWNQLPQHLSLDDTDTTDSVNNDGESRTSRLQRLLIEAHVSRYQAQHTHAHCETVKMKQLCNKCTHKRRCMPYNVANTDGNWHHLARSHKST